jgi:hypothetical protein
LKQSTKNSENNLEISSSRMWLQAAAASSPTGLWCVFAAAFDHRNIRQELRRFMRRK